MKQKIKNEINLLKENNNKTFSLSLLFATIILFVYCYFGSFSFFEKTFSSLQDVGFWKIIYHNLMAFVLFFGFGILFTKFIIKEKLENFGLRAGNKKLGLIFVGIGFAGAILCGLSTVLDFGMASTYPLIDFSVYGTAWQIVLYFASYFLYYVGWEYLFRGILLFGSEQKCGSLGAILLSTLISALIHTSIGGFGKPMIETLSAIPAGLIFGYVSYKTRSIFPSLLIHFFVGLFTDVFIFLLA